MKISKTLNSTIQKHPLSLLLAYALLLRVLIYVLYHHVSIFPDSEDYINLAQYLGHWDLTNYSGQRTPGFPSIIALSGQQLGITVFIQTLFGLLNCYLLFKICIKQTKNISFAFWTTVITTSFLHVILYEFAILTETLSYTLVLLSFWLISKFELLSSHSKIWSLLLLSVVFAALYLTRPMFIYFPIGFALFYVVKNFHFNFKKQVLKGFAVIVVPLLAFYSWNKLNQENIGYFTSSYYLGINLAQTATSFFDKAPEEDKVIRDIFVKHRTFVEDSLPKNKYPMTVWYAYDELLEETNMKPPELSAELGRISVELFKKHPVLYARQVFISWRDFWGASSSLLWNVDNCRNQIAKKGFIGLWNYIQKPLLIVINILFLFFSIKKLLVFTSQGLKTYDFNLFLVAIVWSGSLAQALVAYGTNSRFCFPFFALIVYFVMVNIFSSNILNLKYANRSSS